VIPGNDDALRRSVCSAASRRGARRASKCLTEGSRQRMQRPTPQKNLKARRPANRDTPLPGRSHKHEPPPAESALAERALNLFSVKASKCGGRRT